MNIYEVERSSARTTVLSLMTLVSKSYNTACTEYSSMYAVEPWKTEREQGENEVLQSYYEYCSGVDSMSPRVLPPDTGIHLRAELLY